MSELRHRMPSAKLSSSSAFPSNRGLSTRSIRNQAAGGGLTGVKVSGAEADAILQELATRDEDAKKTWSRICVESFLSKYEWYWPRRNDEKAPSLSKSWAYYEHVTLPRHFVGELAADTVMRRAEPGEHEEDTELYDHCRTPQASLIEWGTGIDLYFISLRFFAVIMLIAGLINISSIMYYSGDAYNGNSDQSDVAFLLRGSAICTNTTWVVCTDCVLEERTRNPRTTPEQDWFRDKERYAVAEDNTVLVLKNLCEGAQLNNGITNFITLVFVLFAVGCFSYYLHLREIRFDEDKVTTTDYSIVVNNPPEDAIDPDKWRDFFSQFATDGDQVSVVTITLNNELLVRKLLNRRNFRNQLRWKLPQGTDLDDEDAVSLAVDQFNKEKEQREVGCMGKFLENCIFPILNLLNMFLLPDALCEKITTLTAEIIELQNEKYDPSRVFVTFETEEGQRTALQSLDVGQIDLMMRRSGAVAPECLFEGIILDVTEPTEPNAVRWLDLSYGTLNKAIRRLVVLLLTAGMVCLAGLAVSRARETVGPQLAGPLTTIFNATIPLIIKILMIIEPHATEGGYQTSLYLKITLFRWTLSAILTMVITPNTSTLGHENSDLLPTIYAILLSDVWLSPLLRLSDWMTNIKKHILAPRAETQEEMNRNFQGTYYNLGERYTDFTKVLFVVFFYSSLFPAGFFFGFVILSIQYLTDKFSLMRIWGWAPLIGSELAVFSRRFFFTGATIAFAVVSSYVWAQFPYDNVCEPRDDDLITGLKGLYQGVTNGENVSVKIDGYSDGDVEVTRDTNMVYCSQSWRNYIGFGFPATPRLQTDDPSWTAPVSEEDLTWMTDSQATFTLMYGWFSACAVFAFVLLFFGKAIHAFILSIFMGNYKSEGDSQHIDFSSNPEIFAYVPQIKQIGQPFPYLACDIDAIDQGLVGWNDASHSYDFYNLIFDVPHKSLHRRHTMEQNTRDSKTIAGHDGYQHDADTSPSEVPSVGSNSLEAGYEVNERPTGRSIYSTIKHYPTKWQIKLAKELLLDSIVEE